jgi:hypothetical protein
VLDMGDELGPRVEAVAPRELAPGVLDVETGRGRDSLRSSFVVLDVGAERLLVREVDTPILGSPPWPI